MTSAKGTCYVIPLLGAFLADAYLGRYWTIAGFSIIYVVGMTLLTLSASIHGLKPSYDRIHGLKPSYDRTNVFHTAGSGTSVFFLGLYLLALGIGGIKPLVETLSFGDQPHQIEAYPPRYFSFFGKAAVETPSDRLKETPFRDCHRFEH
ncbi:hypothetical protein OIU77_017443 [Salix suchowensis]|uniref:Uncharacterized protein n=1 Tax=Salix suchowensis TaxID=1278906 RepID=A0ABQ8ZPB5_9ROSI|nr:hypothetical protein OIU77_017443 [Salix suchowensis]